VISLENDHSVAIRQSTQPPRKKENKTAAERESFSLSFKGGPGQIKKHPTRLSSKEQSALWVAPSLYIAMLSLGPVNINRYKIYRESEEPKLMRFLLLLRPRLPAITL
jgi:hypothetical protein